MALNTDFADDDIMDFPPGLRPETVSLKDLDLSSNITPMHPDTSLVLWPQDDVSMPTGPHEANSGIAQYEDSDTGQDAYVPTQAQATQLEQYTGQQYTDGTDIELTSGARNTTDAGSESGFDDGDSSSAGEESETEPLSPLGYARFHELCRRFDKDNLLGSDLIPFPSPNTEEDANVFDGLFDAETTRKHINESLRERLDVDAQTAAFLSSVLSLGKQSPDNLSERYQGRLSKLKMERPVLKKDHELEMHALRRRNAVKTSAKGIPPFRLKTEKDEGPNFPSLHTRQKTEIDNAIAKEKLDVQEETVEYLRDVHVLLTSDAPDLVNANHMTRKTCGSGHITPPLLPVSPPFSPGQPPAEALQLNLTSTPEDLIARDAAQARRQILEEDEATVVFNHRPGAAQVDRSSDDLLGSFGDSQPPNSPLVRKRLRSLKVEPPLTPQKSDETPPKMVERRAFPEELASLIPQPDTDPSAMDIDTAEDELQAFVKNVAAPIAAAVDYEARNEKLMEVDTTMRVKVPPVDALDPQPPWSVYTGSSTSTSQLQAQRMMLRCVSEELLRGEQKWSGIGKLERLLPWKPFPPHLGKVNLKEEFDDGSLARYLAELNFDEEVDLCAYGGGRKDLLLLADHESDEEELLPVITDESEEETVGPEPRSEDAMQEVIPQIPKLAAPKVNQRPAGGGPQATNERSSMLSLLRKRQLQLAERTANKQPRLGPGDTPSARFAPSTGLLKSDGLAGFMQLQGRTVAEQPNNHTKPASGAQNVAPAALMVSQAQAAQTRPAEETKSDAPTHLPVPALAARDTSPMQVVVSASFMTNHHFTRQLQSALPNVDLIERDTIEPAASRQGNDKAVQSDADMTLSPATGLLNTTLQKLKQKPLPGQRAKSGIRERIAKVAHRYEHLLVLVSEGRAQSGGVGVLPLDERDCEALVDLTAFATSSQADVQIVYVAGGDDELLSWSSAAITRYCVVDGNAKLLQDETLWERFLRSAGLNAIAAQTVLAELKRLDDETEVGMSSPSYPRNLYGLAAFLTMSTAERITTFSRALGGERVLRNVSASLDSGW